VDHLRAFAEAGLHRVHFGIESGLDTILQFMRKGATAADHVRGCLNAKEAGLSCSVYVMPGLGGARWSQGHATVTAAVISDSAPDFVRLRSLEIFPKTGPAAAVEPGEVLEASEEQVVQEIRTLVDTINIECEIVSDNAANLLPVFGRLPEDRGRMLDTIDCCLALPSREKLACSLESRLQSFIGQYGGLTRDVMMTVASYVTADGGTDIARTADEEITGAIRRIRTKLMP
jgi:radical SAM superfamily enzyme